MKEPHIEGVAIHDDPESCTVGRKAEREALTGARTGAVLSRENRSSRAPSGDSSRRATHYHAIGRGPAPFSVDYVRPPAQF